jgi:hypothetical protein
MATKQKRGIVEVSPKKEEKEKEKEITTILVAKLDTDGTYMGTETIDKSSITVDHVQLPMGCDLPIGMYRWDSVSKAFIPISKRRKIMGTPSQEADALTAIAYGFIVLADQGLTIPSQTLIWAKQQLASIDAVGALKK